MREIPQGKSSLHSKPKAKAESIQEAVRPMDISKTRTIKNQWIIDDKAAEVVRRIFHLTMDGKGPYAIARILEADKIDIPAYHQKKLGYGLHKSKVFEYPYRWCSSTIASILKKQENT